ncbi:MAG TPA: magnesium transporter CorA family protein [Actinomycetota bacterium]|nr:magnesium transporter CorA family protein [Actinomycetota bacterium]
MLSAIRHTAEGGWTDLLELDQISDIIGNGGELLWAVADIGSLTEADVNIIAVEFGLHPLAVEDAVKMRQRPKLESYENHLFAVMYQLDRDGEELGPRQISCFIGAGYVLTFHDGARRAIDEAMRRARATPKEPDRGASFVMHALLDTIVDEYQTITDGLEEEVEELEDVALAQPETRLQHRLYSVKQRLARLRRYVLPGERVLAAVVADHRSDFITGRTAAAFRDVHDHALRIIDQLRNIEDITNAILDLQRAEQTQALNEVTKRLTGWAAIIAVPTFIASVYGMNFELIPDEGGITGFFAALGMMATSSIGLYVYFRRRGWI